MKLHWSIYKGLGGWMKIEKDKIATLMKNDIGKFNKRRN